MALLQVGQYPIQLGCKAIGAVHWDGLIDVLTLTAVALRRDHHPAGDHVGDRAAQLAAHQVQARVDAGGGARAGDQVAVVDEEDVAVHLGRRIAPRQLVGVHPVRGAGPAVEQSGRARDERPRTHGQDDGPGIRGGTQRGQRLRRIVLVDDRGHGHQVGTDELAEVVVGGQRGAHRGAQGPAGLRAAHLEVEVGHAVVAAVDAEDLADHPELEDRQAVEDQRGHSADHGSILAEIDTPATVGWISTDEYFLP